MISRGDAMRLCKVLTLIFTLASTISNTTCLNISSSISGFGCFTKRDVIFRMGIPHEKEDQSPHTSESCRAACSVTSNCRLWSFDPGETMRYFNPLPIDKIPQININDPVEVPLPEWPPKSWPKCYLDTGLPLSNLTLKYSFGAVTEFKTCTQEWIGCFQTASNSSIETLDYIYRTRDTNRAFCKSGCNHRNYTYYGLTVQDQTICLCGNYFGLGMNAEEDRCYESCPHMTDGYCWKKDFVAVFSTGIADHDKMCMLGRMRAETQGSSIEPLVFEVEAIQYCRLACKQTIEKICVLWSFNSTHCALYYEAQWLDDHSIGLVYDEGSFIGFGVCNEKREMTYFSNGNAPALHITPASGDWSRTGILSGSHKFTSWKKNPTSGYYVIGERGKMDSGQPEENFYWARDEYGGALRRAKGYDEFWNDKNEYILLTPQCDPGYVSLGDILSPFSREQDHLSSFRCVKEDLTENVTAITQLWAHSIHSTLHIVIWESENPTDNLPSFHFYKTSAHQSNHTIPHQHLPTLKAAQNVSGEYFIYSEHQIAFDTKTVQPDYVHGFSAIISRNATSTNLRDLIIGEATSELLKGGWMMTSQRLFGIEDIRLVRPIKGRGVSHPIRFVEITKSQGYESSDQANSDIRTLVFWRMVCPMNYASLGDVATVLPAKPNVSDYACVHTTFLQPVKSLPPLPFKGGSIYFFRPSRASCTVDIILHILVSSTNALERPVFALKRHSLDKKTLPHCLKRFKMRYRKWKFAMQKYESTLQSRINYIKEKLEEKEIPSYTGYSYVDYGNDNLDFSQHTAPSDSKKTNQGAQSPQSLEASSNNLTDGEAFTKGSGSFSGASAVNQQTNQTHNISNQRPTVVQNTVSSNGLTNVNGSRETRYKNIKFLSGTAHNHSLSTVSTGLARSQHKISDIPKLIVSHHHQNQSSHLKKIGRMLVTRKNTTSGGVTRYTYSQPGSPWNSQFKNLNRSTAFSAVQHNQSISWTLGQRRIYNYSSGENARNYTYWSGQRKFNYSHGIMQQNQSTSWTPGRHRIYNYPSGENARNYTYWSGQSKFNNSHGIMQQNQSTSWTPGRHRIYIYPSGANTRNYTYWSGQRKFNNSHGRIYQFPSSSQPSKKKQSRVMVPSSTRTMSGSGVLTNTIPLSGSQNSTALAKHDFGRATSDSSTNQTDTSKSKTDIATSSQLSSASRKPVHNHHEETNVHRFGPAEAYNEENFLHITVPKTFGEALSGWGCYRLLPDLAVLSTRKFDQFQGNLHHHCGHHCQAKEGCLAWSYVPDRLGPPKSAKCYYTYNTTSKPSLAYVRGASTGFTVCNSGYIGCFQDSTPRDLPTIVMRKGTNTTSCIKECRRYSFAGLQNHRECWCGRAFGRYQQSRNNGTECSRACIGSPTDNCGAHFQNSVYRTGTAALDSMCVLGRFYITNNVTAAASSTKSPSRCAIESKLKKMYMWSHDGNKCKLISKSDLNERFTFISGELTYTGMSECRMQRHQSDELYQTTLTGKDGKTGRKAFYGMTASDTSVVATMNNGAKLWSVGKNQQPGNNWRMLGNVASLPETSHKNVELVRPWQGKALEQPIGFTLITSQNSNKFWRPICPQEYQALGDVVENTTASPDPTKFACVHQAFLVRAKIGNESLWKFPRSDFEIRKIYKSECPGQDLSLFRVVNPRYHTGKVFTLKPRTDLSSVCPEPTNPPTTASTTTTTASTTTTTAAATTATTAALTTTMATTTTSVPLPTTAKPLATAEAKLTAGEAISGWGCFEERDVVLKGRNENATIYSGLGDRDNCEDLCRKSPNCVAWSFVPATLAPWKGNNSKPQECFHVDEDDILANLSLVWSPGAFTGLIKCSGGYVGCLKDQMGLRDLEEIGLKENSTVDSCRETCRQSRAAYFGLQFGKECWCGTSFGSHGWMPHDSNCSTKCIFNTSQICGHKFTNSVYRTGIQDRDYMRILGETFLHQETVERYGDTFPEQSVYNCKYTCKDDCMVWAHNMTHCVTVSHERAEMANEEHGGIKLEPSAKSFVGFGELHKGELLKSGNISMSMKVILRKLPRKLGLTIPEKDGKVWTLFPNDATFEDYYALGQVALSNTSGSPLLGVVLAKTLVGKPLKEMPELHNIWSRYVPRNSQIRPMKVYHMECPEGYSSLGNVVSFASNDAREDLFRCIHSDFLRPVVVGNKLYSERDGRLRTISLWETVPTDPERNFNFHFFKAVDYLEPPEEDHLHLYTLPKVLPEQDGSYLYRLRDDNEIEVSKSDAWEPSLKVYHQRSNETLLLRMFSAFNEENLRPGYFKVGQVASAGGEYDATISTVRNIQGKGLSAPLSFKRIGRASVYNDSEQTGLANVTFWQLICSQPYHSLSDVVTLNDEVPDANQYACVHRSHLTPAHAGGVLWDVDAQALQAVRVEPDSCDEGQQMNFFIASSVTNLTERELYVLKKSPNISYDCQQAVSYPHKIQGVTIIKKIPLTASALKKSFDGFQRDLLLMGRQIKGIHNLLSCRDTCLDKCVASSFQQDFQQPNNSKCYHVQESTLLEDVRMLPLKNAFTFIHTNGSSSGKSLPAKCAFAPIFLSPEENIILSTSEVTAIGDCATSCAHTTLCAVWSTNRTHCVHFSMENLRDNRSRLNGDAGGVTGFSKCEYNTDLWSFDNREIFRVGLHKGRNKVTYSSRNPTNQKTLKVYEPDIFQGHYAVGHVATNGKNGDNLISLTASNVRGDSLLPPSGFTRVDFEDRHIQRNGSLWKAICPKGSSTLSLFGSRNFNPPDLDKVRCINNHYLTKASYGQYLWNDSTIWRIRQVSPSFNNGNNLNFFQLQNNGTKEQIYALPKVTSDNIFCSQPKSKTKCRAISHRFWFNQSSLTCEIFNDGGCLQNDNNFQTPDECYDSCAIGGSTFTYRHGSAMMLQGRDHYPDLHNVDVTPMRTRESPPLDIWGTTNLTNGWKSVGQVYLRNPKFQNTFQELRNVYGDGIIPAANKTPIGTVEMYKSHRDVHHNEPSNLTFYRLECKEPYVSLSDVAEYQDKPIPRDEFYCVHRAFVAPGKPGLKILSLTHVANPTTKQKSLRSIDPASSEGEQSEFFAAFLSEKATNRSLYVLQNPSPIKGEVKITPSVNTPATQIPTTTITSEPTNIMFLSATKTSESTTTPSTTKTTSPTTKRTATTILRTTIPTTTAPLPTTTTTTTPLTTTTYPSTTTKPTTTSPTTTTQTTTTTTPLATTTNPPTTTTTSSTTKTIITTTTTTPQTTTTIPPTTTTTPTTLTTTTTSTTTIPTTTKTTPTTTTKPPTTTPTTTTTPLTTTTIPSTTTKTTTTTTPSTTTTTPLTTTTSSTTTIPTTTTTPPTTTPTTTTTPPTTTPTTTTTPPTTTTIPPTTTTTTTAPLTTTSTSPTTTTTSSKTTTTTTTSPTTTTTEAQLTTSKTVYIKHHRITKIEPRMKVTLTYEPTTTTTPPTTTTTTTTSTTATTTTAPKTTTNQKVFVLEERGFGLDVFLTGMRNFYKNNIVLQGQKVTPKHNVKITKKYCKDECLNNFKCASWSYEAIPKDACYLVSMGDKNVQIKHSKGSILGFNMYNQDSTSGNCTLPNAQLQFSRDSQQPNTGSPSRDECHSSCSDSLESCYIWQFKNRECWHLSAKFLETNNVTLAAATRSSVGFGVCSDGTNYIYDSKISAMSMQVYKIPPSTTSFTHVEVATGQNSHLYATYPNSLVKKHHIIGQPISKTEENFEYPLYARNLTGLSLANPERVNLKYSGPKGNVWNIDCPVDYKTLSDVIAPPGVDADSVKGSHRCVHTSYLQPSTVNETLKLRNGQALNTIGSGNMFTLSTTPPVYALPIKQPDSRGRFIYNNDYYTILEVQNQPKNIKALLPMKTFDNPSLYFTASDATAPWVKGPQQASLIEQDADKVTSFRNILGNGMVPPIGAKMVGKVLASPDHHGLHNPSELRNYTFWRLECPGGYQSLGDVVKKNHPPPDLSKQACVHQDFLSKGYLDKSMWSDSSVQSDQVHLWKVKKCSDGINAVNSWVSTSSVRPDKPQVYYLKEPYDVGGTEEPICPHDQIGEDMVFTNEGAGAQLELRTNWPWNKTFEWRNKQEPVTAWEPYDGKQEYYIIGQTAVKGLDKPHSSKAVMARSISGNALATPKMASYWSIGDYSNTDIANTSLWHIKCPDGYATLSDIAVPGPTYSTSLTNNYRLQQNRYKCVLKEFVEPTTVAMQPLWYVNSSKYGVASMWPMQVPESNTSEEYQFGFFKGADHVERPHFNFSALIPYASKKGNVYQLRNTKEMSFQLRKVANLNKAQELVVPSFRNITYSFWQPKLNDGFKQIGQVTSQGNEYDGHSYTIKDPNDTKSIVQPKSSEKIGKCWNAPCYIWKANCPKNYHILSDFVLPYGETLDLENTACVHKDFLTPIRSDNFASIGDVKLEKAMHDASCSALDLNFFTVVQEQPMYSIKNGSDLQGCNSAPGLSYVYGDDITTAADLQWVACFSKRDVILKGTPVTTENELGDPDIEKCKILCQLSEDCLAWSFVILESSKERCFYVYKNDPLNELRFEGSPGAFMELKTCSLDSLTDTYLGCYQESTEEDFKFVAMDDNATIDSCIRECAKNQFPFAALQKDAFNINKTDKCRCGKRFGSRGDSDETLCTYKCRQEKSQTCGGPTSLSVHLTGAAKSDQTMCIIAGGELLLSTGLPVEGADTLSKCQISCSKQGVQDCYMWSYNSGQCTHVPMSSLADTNNHMEILTTYTGNAFIGFSNCSDQPGLIYEALNHESRLVATYRQADKILLSRPIRIPPNRKAFVTYEPVDSNDEGNDIEFSLGQIAKPGTSPLDALMLQVSNDSSQRHLLDAEFDQIWPVEAEYDKDNQELYEGSRFWRMRCPENYRSMGDVSSLNQNPPVNEYKCIYKGLVQEAKIGKKLWSYVDKYDQGNFSVWSIETRSPKTNPRSNYFVVSTNFEKPNVTVYEIKPKFADISGRWRETIFTEDLRFEAKLSDKSNIILSWNKSQNSNTPQLLNKAQSAEVQQSDSKEWLAIREPAYVYGNWKVLGQKFVSPLVNQTHGIRVGRNIEGGALKSPLSLNTFAFLTATGTDGQPQMLEVKSFGCQPEYKALGQLIDIVYDQAYDDSENELENYVCVHEQFLTKAKLGPKLWTFAGVEDENEKTQNLSLHQIVPEDNDGESLGFFQAAFDNDTLSEDSLYTLKKHKDGIYPVYVPVIAAGDTPILVKSAVDNSIPLAGAGTKDESHGDAQPRVCDEPDNGFMIGFIILLILLIIVTAILIYTCCKKPPEPKDDTQ